MRTNIYKGKIVELLKNNHLLSIADIHTKIPNVNYSTVYRNIEQMVSNGGIKKIVLDKDIVVYELNNKADQHDHFLCTDCGDVEEINISSKKLLSTNHKIQDVLVKGLCSDCNKV